MPLRMAPDGLEGIDDILARSDEILNELWDMAEELARSELDSEMLALYVESLNETIDVNTTRVTAGLYARVPETIVLLLVIGAGLTLGMVGFNMLQEQIGPPPP